MSAGTDFQVQDHGSVVILQPLTEAASDWVDENLPTDVMTWGGGVAVEPRYIMPIIEGIEEDGLTVQ